MMRRAAILHVGMPKTGSSSLQSFLAANRHLLVRQGFAFPSFLGSKAHWRLALFTNDLKLVEIPREGADLHSRQNIATYRDQSDFRAAFRLQFRNEIEMLPSAVHTVVLSAVQLYNLSEGESLRLKKLLDKSFSRVQVLIYLRRQDEVLISEASTALIAGKTLGNNIFSEQQRTYDLRYDMVLRKLADAFGKENVMVRLYEAGEDSSFDLVKDFCTTIRLEIVGDFERPTRVNTSLDETGQAILKLVNKVRPRRGPDQEQEWRQGLVGLLRHRHSGRAPEPPLRHREALLGSYAASNEHVRAEWFPDRPHLFTPLQGTPQDPTGHKALPVAEEAIDMLVQLCANCAAESRALRAEQFLLKGLLCRRDDSRQAERCFREALELDSQNLRARIALAQLKMGHGDLDDAAKILSRTSTEGCPEPQKKRVERLQSKIARAQSGVRRKDDSLS